MHPWASDDLSRDEGTSSGLVNGDVYVWPAPSGAEEPDGRLTPDELREYAPEIRALGAAGLAEQRFRRYREARLTLVGTGPVLAALLRRALRTGCRDIHVRHTRPADADGLAELVEGSRRDSGQRVCVQPDHGVLTLTDTVLQVSGSVAELIATADGCARAGASLGQVLFSGDEMWTGPVGPADRTAAASAWRRLRGGPAAGAAPGGALAGPLPEIGAHQLFSAWYRCATGVAGPYGSPYLVRTDLRTWTAGRHRFLSLSLTRATRPVAQAEARAAFLGRLGGAGVEADRLLQRASAVEDARTGLVGPVDEKTVEVGPFSRWECEMAVADPFGARPAGAPDVTVTGHGGDRRTAYLTALLAALAAYGALAARPRGPGAPDVWGLDLVTGGLRRIPARNAHPGWDPASPARPPVGAAAGLTWAHAVEDGLAQHCDLLLARRLAEPGTRVPRLALPTDETVGLADVLCLLYMLGDPVVHDLSALLSVPACAIRLGAKTVVATGATRSAAVRTAAERALLTQRSDTWTVPAITSEQEESDGPFPGGRRTIGRARLAEVLRTRGRTPVGVLLDHDPQAVAVLPYAVQVVLVDE
ncbi:hypothetical protein AB0O68_26085 [Streptomyces sp. NPDC087512]|uniref:hypothetical protein n=1 Tax=Streptomyces sp. NPDC087512 TaxID=3155059 RepID=UPI0034216884